MKFKIIALAVMTIALLVTFGFMYLRIQSLQHSKETLEATVSTQKAQIETLEKASKIGAAISSGEAERGQERSKRRKVIQNEIEATDERENHPISRPWRDTLDRLYEHEGDL